MTDLTIKNKFAVICNVVSGKWLIISVLLGVSFIFAIATYPSIHTVTDDVLVWVKSLLLPVIYKLYLSIDAYVFSQKSVVHENENGVTIHSGNLFTNNQINLLYSQLEGVRVVQPFRFKLFGISQIIFDQTNGVSTNAWGFSYQDAQDFTDKISKNFAIKVKNK